MPPAEPPILHLFAPADRPDRFDKALRAGADAVIFDLEDAVAPERKALARDALAAAAEIIAAAPCGVVLRVNAAATPAHAADCALAAGLKLSAVLLPKAESAEAVNAVRARTGHPVLALIESARGLAACRAIAGVAERLVFGSIDFAADLGCAHTRDALIAARLELVLASRLAGLAAPVDGVTAEIGDPAQARADAAYAASLGFGGKLLVHPSQIAPAREGFAPSAQELAWAERVLATPGGATRLAGEMIDPPVRLRAEQIRRRASANAHQE
jgi:citrate lyase subunit beta/citryl-CoA lyase